jgi:hypothetical protein
MPREYRSLYDEKTTYLSSGCAWQVVTEFNYNYPLPSDVVSCLSLNSCIGAK